MRTISVISQKGGAGKTTVAVHLAVAAAAHGKVSLIIDTDPQATAMPKGEVARCLSLLAQTAPPDRPHQARILADWANLMMAKPVANET